MGRPRSERHDMVFLIVSRSKREEGLSSGEVRERLNKGRAPEDCATAQAVCTSLRVLCDEGKIVRSGERGSFAYKAA